MHENAKIRIYHGAVITRIYSVRVRVEIRANDNAEIRAFKNAEIHRRGTRLRGRRDTGIRKWSVRFRLITASPDHKQKVP